MALSGVIRAAFLTAVLLYFTGDQSLVDGGVDYKDFIMDSYEDWIQLVSLAFKYGVPEAHETITEYLDRLREKCQEDKHCKTALDFMQRLYQKYEQKMRAKKVIAVIIILGPELAQDILTMTASHPIGLAADAAQIILEMYGYEKTGKFVGAGGNILGGILAGATCGGMPGAIVGGPAGAFVGGVIGGVMGLGIWSITEWENWQYPKSDITLTAMQLTLLRNPNGIATYHEGKFDHDQQLQCFAKYFEE